MAMSAATTSGYVDLDVYGRGDDSVFGPGARQENARSAKLHLRELRDKKAGIQVRDIIDYDLYGRGDPRVFGKDAHLVNRSEGRAHLKQTRAKNKHALRFLMLPARTRALVRNVTKKVKQSEQKVPEPKSTEAPDIAKKSPQEIAVVSESPSFASTTKRVSSLLPIEEAKPRVEDGIVLQGIHSFNSEDTIKIDLEDVEVDKPAKNKNAGIAAVVGMAGAAAIGGTVVHLSSKLNENTQELSGHEDSGITREKSGASFSSEWDENVESSDTVLSGSTSVEEESESAEDSESAEESNSASEEIETGEEFTSLYDQDESFAREIDVPVNEKSSDLGVGDTANDKNMMEIDDDSQSRASTEQGETQNATGSPKLGTTMSGSAAGGVAVFEREKSSAMEEPVLVVAPSPVAEVAILEESISEMESSAKPSNRILDLASPTTPNSLPETSFNKQETTPVQDLTDSDDGTMNSSEKSKSGGAESVNSSARVSASGDQESSLQESSSSLDETPAFVAASAPRFDSEHASVSSAHEGGSSYQESTSSAAESDSSANESVSSKRGESDGKMRESAIVPSRQDSSSEDVVEDDGRTATLSSSERTMSEESSEVAVSSSEAVSSSDDVMTDSDEVSNADSDDEFVDVVDNVEDLRELAS